MSATNVREVEEQIQEFWAPLFVPELKESALLPLLVNTEYSADIKQQGDTAYVSMVHAAKGERQEISEDGSHTVIKSEKLKTTRVGIQANQIFTASFELDSLIDLQSQLGSADGQSKIRAALLKGVELQINEYIYSLLSPSASGPDHILSGVSAFDFTQLQNVRKLASKAKWPADGNWSILLDPTYMGDFLSDTKNTSGDYVSDSPLIKGVTTYQRSGFKIMEDNSDAMAAVSPTKVLDKLGLAFHKDFLYLVAQTEPSFKLSDLHGTKKRGYLLTVDLLGGAKLGLEADKKHITIFNA